MGDDRLTRGCSRGEYNRWSPLNVTSLRCQLTNSTSTANRAVSLVVFIVICFAAAAIGSMATSSSVGTWYADLNKPAWNPPNWVFAPVWSALFLLMAISAWMVWNSPGGGKVNLALAGFFGQLGLNVLWSVLFFGLQQPGIAAIEIVVLWLSILAVSVLFYFHSRLAAALLVPYLVWVGFATVLNWCIWQLN